MRIVADENCDRILVAELRSAGFDVVWVREFAPGISDDKIFEIAVSDCRVLLTSDQGFGLLAEQTGAGRPPAIVIMRLERVLPSTRTSMAVQVFTTMGEDLRGQLTVIEPHQVRSRPFKN